MRAASLDKIQPPQRVGPLCEMRVTIPQAGDDPHPLGIERVEILIPTRRTRSDGGDAPMSTGSLKPDARTFLMHSDSFTAAWILPRFSFGSHNMPRMRAWCAIFSSTERIAPLSSAFRYVAHSDT